jgi:predicted ATP-binding protein involved in virulence
MNLSQLRLKNFRCFEDVTIQFHPHFNVLIGDNGSGKTAVLEGLRIATASFFLGIDEVNSRDIQLDDIRFVNYEHHLEPQFPVQVEGWGNLAANQLSWLRELTGKSHKTTVVHAKSLKELAADMQQQVRAGKAVILPVIAYYSTGRLWSDKNREKELIGKGSRFKGYYNGMNPTSNNFFFTQWFKSKELVALQRGERAQVTELEVVRKTVSQGVPDCETLFFDLAQETLMMVFKDQRILPFHLLSDGVRNMLAIVADIAFRCITLNPHLGEQAVTESSGVILIDEIDLHLHPVWQEKVVQDLKRIFPSLQFIATTHSPLILSGVQDKVITLTNQNAYATPHTYGRDMNDILSRAMGAKVQPEFVQTALEKYLALIEMAQGQSDEARQLRRQLESWLGVDYHEFARADTLMALFA